GDRHPSPMRAFSASSSPVAIRTWGHGIAGDDALQQLSGAELISVIIPTFNRIGQTRRALASVTAQTGIDPDDLEILVVDDASTPPLALDAAGSNVRILRLARNAGPAGARNAGIAASRGEYLAFLDSDDSWLAGKLGRQAAAFKALERTQDRSLMALTCGFYYPRRMSGRIEARLPHGARQRGEFVLGCWFCPGSTLFVHRAALERVGPFDEKLKRLEDFEWFIRFGVLGGRLHVCPHMGVIVRPSYSVSYDEVLESSRLIWAELSAAGPFVLAPEERRRLLAYLELERGAAALIERRNLLACFHLAKSFLLIPRFRPAVGRFWERGGESPGDTDEICLGRGRPPMDILKKCNAENPD
ncbi:MAG: glycosyltransferase family 2 protein, partial [Xanthobacteraceae bacterium]